MKKTLLVLLCAFIAVSACFAWQNTYSSESDEYKILIQLCKIAGRAPISMVSPISSDRMLAILNSIDVNKLDTVSAQFYYDLKSELEKPDFLLEYDNNLGINGIADFSYQFLKQSTDMYSFLIPKRDRKPMLNLGAEIYLNKNIYGYFAFDMTETGSGYKDGKISKFTDNFNLTYDEFDMSTPHKAFVSLGNEYLSFIIGRDRMSLGNGRTGNMLLGDNLWYQDFVKASAANGPISYDLTAISFENSTGSTIEEHRNNPLEISHNALFEENHQVVVMHTFSFAPIEKFSFSISEGALFYGKGIFEDFRRVNPMFVIHNIYDYMINANSGNTNNYFGGELNYSVKGFTFDCQAVFDQIQFKDEQDPDNVQNAFGVLFNVSKTTTLYEGLADFYFEVAYTSPNLYLRQESTACGEYWNMDLIFGRQYVWSPSDDNDISYLGYKHGPDTIAVGTGFEWRNLKKLKLKADMLLKFHGTQGAMFYESQKDFALLYGQSLKNVFITSPLETRLVFNIFAGYPLTEYLTLDGAAGLQQIWCYKNIENNNQCDFQFAIAATVSPFAFINKK